MECIIEGLAAGQGLLCFSHFIFISIQCRGNGRIVCRTIETCKSLCRTTVDNTIIYRWGFIKIPPVFQLRELNLTTSS